MFNKSLSRTTSITILGMFAAIIALLSATFLGFIPVPGLGSATTLHIPVIVASLMLGPKYGAVVGFMFGVASVVRTTVMPVVSSFVFSPFIPVYGTDRGSPFALVVAFVPRIILGILPWFLYKGIKRLTTDHFMIINLAVTGVISSIMHTLMVMHLWYFFFRNPWAIARGRGELVADMYAVVLFIISTAGLAEAIVAGVLVPAICFALYIVLRRSFGFSPRISGANK